MSRREQQVLAVSGILLVVTALVLGAITTPEIPFIERTYTVTDFDAASTHLYQTHRRFTIQEEVQQLPANASAVTKTEEVYYILKDLTGARIEEYTYRIDADNFGASPGLTDESLRQIKGSVYIAYNGRYYNLTTTSYPTPNADLRWNAQLVDRHVEAGDPAVINVTVTNTGDNILYLMSGVFWPFNDLRPQRQDGHSFLLWSPSYERQLKRNLTGYDLNVIPATQLFKPLSPNGTVTRRYTIPVGLKDVRPGTYTTTSNHIELASFPRTVTMDDLEQPPHNRPESRPAGTLTYNLTFTLQPTGYLPNLP